MSPVRKPRPAPEIDIAAPESLAELFDWIRHNPALGTAQAEQLISGIAQVLARHEELWQQSKQDALQAMSVGFADRMRRMREELAARETTVSSITRYFEALVADLTDRADRDPKTRLMNFQRFIERLEAFVALEQRGAWCAVGLADIRSFKWYNDAFGHALGDRVIDRVARLLREQVRANDLLAQESVADPRRELHARFGGDEFCFLIPDLDDCSAALVIAERFREAVERYDWVVEDPRLAEKPVRVDVGIVCLMLSDVSERRPIAHELAQELLERADKLMYEAKNERTSQIYPLSVRIQGGTLVELAPGEHPA
jgi:diguanylate cyclase